MNTKRTARALLFLALAACALASAHITAARTQQQQKDSPAPASVSGRVRIGERGVSGVHVVLMPAESVPERRIVARAKTDAEGFYRMTGVAPGRYRLMPAAPAHIVAEGAPSNPGLLVMLSAGESFEDAHFTLERGGVITGRVADADGRPVVGEGVRIEPVGETRELGFSPVSGSQNLTDDRGVYRLYGLPPGRYRVSVGRDTGGMFFGTAGPRGYYQRTFHPDTTDAARATVVEVKEGDEATDVDITLGRLSKTFRASGRVTNAATGEPAAGVMVSSGPMDRRENRVNATGMRSETNARGEFKFEGLMPGRYGAFVLNERATDAYSDVTVFEVTDSDVSGIEVKTRRGSSLSGTISIEGVSDRARAAQLIQRLALNAYADSREGLTAPRYDRATVNADGSFHITGLRPGTIRLLMAYPPVKGLSLLRMELNGTEQRNGIEVAEGAHVTGVRVVFAYGTARIRGQVVARDGGEPAEFPRGTRFVVYAQRQGVAGATPPLSGRSTEVDARGRFLLEDLPPGETMVVVNAFGPQARPLTTRQVVNVIEGAETSVTLTLDLSQTQNPNPRPIPER